MARIFFVLALFATSLLVANAVVGFWIGDYAGAVGEFEKAMGRVSQLERRGGADAEQLREARQLRTAAAAGMRPARSRFRVHMWLGVAASLVTILINSITVTYFIGTSRWCQEVADTYGLEPSLAQRSARLKRRTFPWALGSILMVIAIVALGGASDPAANLGSSGNWVLPHYLAALAGIAMIGYSFLVQVANIGANYDVIETILTRVRDLRAARGLDQPPLTQGSSADTEPV